MNWIIEIKSNLYISDKIYLNYNIYLVPEYLSNRDIYKESCGIILLFSFGTHIDIEIHRNMVLLQDLMFTWFARPGKLNGLLFVMLLVLNHLHLDWNLTVNLIVFSFNNGMKLNLLLKFRNRIILAVYFSNRFRRNWKRVIIKANIWLFMYLSILWLLMVLLVILVDLVS